MAGERSAIDAAIEHLIRNVMGVVMHDYNVTLIKLGSQVRDLEGRAEVLSRRIEDLEGLLRRIVRGEAV